MRILGASLGRCIHVAGLMNFLRLAEDCGHRVEFLGAAVPPRAFAEAAAARKCDLAVVSYRLTPDTLPPLLEALKDELAARGLARQRLAFGGTPPAAAIARRSKLFEAVFSGQEPRERVLSFLRAGRSAREGRRHADALVARIAEEAPMPLLRHHLGLETVAKTVAHARKVARSGELDVLSLAPDQNAQEFFFRPREMPKTGHGAGGAPLRREAHLRAIYRATRCGNYPLVRCYAGTRDLLRWAKMCRRSIRIAWGAVPLFWYSELDRRSTRPLERAIAENQRVIRWYGERGIPLEVNDSHQWSLRDAHDALAVAVAFLAAYNAKALGVRHYVSQYMLNTPPATAPAADLAKMLAKVRLIEGLHDRRFTSFREIRTGLSSMPPDPDRARGHLAATVTLGMALAPHIVHVVGWCEAQYAATATEIIESCRIVRAAVRQCLKGLPAMDRDPAVRRRSRRLADDARRILDAIRSLGRGPGDPLTRGDVLAEAVRRGILDAPHLCGSGVAPGTVATLPVGAGCDPVEARTGRRLPERTRLARLGIPSTRRASSADRA